MTINGNYIKLWGLGIGDWAIPNSQYPIPNPLIIFVYYLIIILIII